MIALKLAKAGYYGGDPEKVLSARVDMVINLISYEGFLNDYEAVEWKMNNPD